MVVTSGSGGGGWMCPGVTVVDVVAGLGRRSWRRVEPVAVAGGEVAYVMYTSGSTGRPRVWR